LALIPKSDEKDDLGWLIDVFASLCVNNKWQLENAMSDYLNYKIYLKKINNF
jgi:hypothetical protein